MATRVSFIQSAAVVVLGIMLGTPASTAAGTLTSVPNAQSTESTGDPGADSSVATSGSSTQVTPHVTRAECRKAAQFNQQHCKRMKGNAMVACYVAVGAMLAACLATAKG